MCIPIWSIAYQTFVNPYANFHSAFFLLITAAPENLPLQVVMSTVLLLELIYHSLSSAYSVYVNLSH